MITIDPLSRIRDRFIDKPTSMRRFLFFFAFLTSFAVEAQVLANYFFEPTSDPQIIVLETHVFHTMGIGLVEQDLTITANSIEFSMCYQTGSSQAYVYDIQQFTIELPEGIPEYDFEISFFVSNGEQNCDSEPWDQSTMTLPIPYNPQGTHNVPDDSFEAFLENEGFGDGIEDNELVSLHRFRNLGRLEMDDNALYSLGLDPIMSLEGIQILSRLQNLNVAGNQISEFDLSNHTEMKYLNISSNNIPLQETQYCPDLIRFWAFQTSIGNIDLSNNTELRWLGISSPNVNDVNLSGLNNLDYLQIGDTQITEIDLFPVSDLQEIALFRNDLLQEVSIPDNPHLRIINVNDNALLNNLNIGATPDVISIEVKENPMLMSLDVSGSNYVRFLSVNDNSLSSLDLSQNGKLESVQAFSNQLESLNVRNGNNNELVNFLAFNNPDLFCVEVDDPTDPPIWWIFDNEVIFDLDCDSDNAIPIPDPNFLYSLVNENIANLGSGAFQDVDTNDDGLIQESEALAVIQLAVPGRDIETINGIQYFRNLTYLSVSHNHLSFVDLSQNHLLELLDVWKNSITELDVSHLTELEILDVADNQLQQFDISSNSQITWFRAHRNRLHTLNLRNGHNELIEFMTCSYNPDLFCVEVDDPNFANAQEDWIKDEQTSYSENCLLGIVDNGLDIGLYPNPATDRVQIESTEPIDRIKLYDVAGQLVLETTIGNQPIELGNLPSGLYFVRVEAGSKRATQKLIIR